MERLGLWGTVRRLLSHGKLRVLLVAAPGLTAAVATITAQESSLVFTAILNAAVGVIISSALFIVVSMTSQQMADDHVSLVKATHEGTWKARSAQLANVRHQGSGLYSDWYFRLRLEEEIQRARRYGMELAILIVKGRRLHQGAQGAGGWFDDAMYEYLRRSDLAALLRDGSLGILLPHTGERAAQGLCRRLEGHLGSDNVRLGLAICPREGDNTDALIERALQAATDDGATATAQKPPAATDESTAAA